MTRRAVNYTSYLALDEVLAAQRPLSVGPDGRPEHDELLFIVIHQVYELWFKQLLHELAEIQRTLEAADTDRTLHLLNRVLKILKTLVAQIDVLETMTPLQFTSFRDRLESASGFQSAQFREIEAVLGRRDASAPKAHPEGSAGRARIEAAQTRRSLWGSFLAYLVARGNSLPADVLARGVALPPEPDERVQDVLVALYRGDADGALVAERLVDLDEGFQEWRYRHLKMVERTIGTKRGTGGSAGVEYLRTTLFQPVFPDLWEIRGRL
ncbi:MAG TPA: tryptophan 2,3-dioxygenase family protein [Candidatus Limnocylindrales bacterium]